MSDNGKPQPIDDIAQVKRTRFLEAIAQTGNITGAARIAGCSREAHYRWKAEDPDYCDEFAAAMETAADLLELEARRRGLIGVDKPVYRTAYADGKPVGSEVVGHIREYSDKLLADCLRHAGRWVDQPRVVKHEGEVTLTVRDIVRQLEQGESAEVIDAEWVEGRVGRLTDEGQGGQEQEDES